MPEQYTVFHYERDGKDIFQEWLDNLRDMQGRTAILRRIQRIKTGNLGSNHFCRDGVWELVIDIGPGYRVYYAMSENVVVLLLCAGSKRTQQQDIDKAVEYLQEFRERNKENGH